MGDQLTQKKAGMILAACVMFNLTIGVLYAWGVITPLLTAPAAEGGYGWTVNQAGLPFSTAIIMIAVMVLVGGRMQDKVGPRKVLTIGGILVGLGLVLSGFIGNSPVGITISFGIIMASGTGISYASLTPPALKWFHSGKKGFVSGLIVGGFGLSAVFYAPITSALLERFGLETTFIILGCAIFVICMCLAQIIKNPPVGYVPAAPAQVVQAVKSTPAVDFSWREMVATRRFHLMCVIYFFAASVGLMIIGNASTIARTQANITDAAILAAIVSLLAFTNTFGRVAGGFVSDKIGRINTLFVILVLQAVNMAAFAFYHNLFLLIIGVIFAGLCFGALLSVMPALCADAYGLKNFGLNYGILFLFWGLAGFVAPIVANLIYDTTGSFNTAYIICAVITGLMIFANFALKKEFLRN
ncbi:MAG: OFA family MFS transporter [Defluviitaleaceae bacterium]|nr:OFA family MFS transporter [Defluviitaleaceae bacterium]